MPTTRRTFAIGTMDKDTDERLLPDGVFREARNVNVITSEDSDEGSVENSLSNKKLTNLTFGTNAATLGGYADTARKKLYWFVLSDFGCYLMEYDIENKATFVILKDTRTPNERVLNLKRNDYIAIAKIISNNVDEDLLLWTNNNSEVCCINIERAKTYAENSFTGDDIYLIKKPPLFAPFIEPLNLAIRTNDLSKEFIAFAYRYQYLDGEYSALSPFTKYMFGPKKYDIDYFELINKGMVNRYNAVRVNFNTGLKQVKRIQICFKKSNSNNIYIIETFDKEKEGWLNDEQRNITFLNNKLYKVLPEKELYRQFDNVPKRAKALDVVGNRVMLGNYVDGYDMVKIDGNPVKMDYTLSQVKQDLDNDTNLNYSYSNLDHTLLFQTPAGLIYNKGGVLIFVIVVKFQNTIVYTNNFQFVVQDDFMSIGDIAASADFQSFADFINIDFKQHYNENSEWSVPAGYVIDTHPEILLSIVGGVPRFTLSDAIFLDGNNGNAPVTIDTTFDITVDDVVAYSETSNAESCKTNMSYSVGLIYRDDFGRATTVQTTDKNTLFIPQIDSDKKNSIKLKIYHEPPAWATNFKVAVKADPLSYEVVYINEFYNDGVYVWAKLENANKDKVKPGDYLNVKIAGGAIIPNPVEVKVLDVLYKEKNFIEDNEIETPDGPVDIIEPEGLYMKIRPEGFSMDLSDYSTNIDEGYGKLKGNSGKPIAYVDLFSSGEYPTPGITDMPIGVGSIMKLRIESKRVFKNDGWTFLVYEKTLIASRDYDSIEEWFNEELLNGNSIWADETPGDAKFDIKNDLSLVRGYRVVGYDGQQVFSPNANGKLYLKIVGHYNPSPSRTSHVTGNITLRSSTGIFVFETIQKKIETEIYYELPETYKVNARNHIVTESNGTQEQSININQPAIVDISFFNCYAQGNGVESYKVKDDFNVNSLNIDLRPSAVSVEPYRETRRYADITYSEPFVESSNVNGLNEFNASTANWKELDKDNGEIMIIAERESNALVVQKNKWGYVLYGKDLLFNADGTTNVSSVPEVLGQFVPYGGKYGITDPQTFVQHGYRCYGVDKERGVVLRLSQNGISEITKGMADWFRDKLYEHKDSRVIGGIDPYNKLYQITIGDKPINAFVLRCGNTIVKNGQDDPFTYYLELNDLLGEVQIEYELTGMVEITAEIGGNTYSVQLTSGSGDFTFPRNSLDDTHAYITVVPYSTVDIELVNICPKGTGQRVIMYSTDDKDKETDVTQIRFKINEGNFFEEDYYFGNHTIFSDKSGTATKGIFPNDGDTITVQSDGVVKYLITDTVYEDKDLATVDGLATTISLDADGIGSFVFNKTLDDDILYIIWDFSSNNNS